MKSCINLHMMKILIIDNSDNSANLLKAILKDFVSVQAVTCFADAQNILNNQVVDLILLSFILPKMKGTEASARINDMHEDIPIIMVTADDSIETLQSSFEHGAIDYIAKPFKGPELVSRVQAHLIRKHVSDERKKIAITDPLTEIYNRRHFDTIFENFYSRALAEKKTLSFFMIDIDNFKKYNDNYGHQKGDKALQEVATLLQKQLHRTDDYLFRLGGEEFAILLYDTPEPFLKALSINIHKSLQDLNIKHEFNENFGHVSVSIGVSVALCKSDISKFMIYNSADEELYKSKKGGRKQTSFIRLPYLGV